MPRHRYLTRVRVRGYNRGYIDMVCLAHPFASSDGTVTTLLMMRTQNLFVAFVVVLFYVRKNVVLSTYSSSFRFPRSWHPLRCGIAIATL